MSSGKLPASVQFNIDPNWKVILLCVLTLPLLISLGFWQLDRAEQKRERQLELERAQAQAPAPLSSENIDALSLYRRVLVEGSYLAERNWLVDNKLRNGRVGYEVITAFELSTGGTLLVNRGWVEAGVNRSERPDPAVPRGAVTLFAQLLSPSDHPLLDGTSTDERWPKVILAIDPEPMTEHLGRSLPERYVRLDQGSPGALMTDWPELEVGSATHMGYAFQWFAMSVALVIWFVFANSNLWAWWRGRSTRASADQA